MIAEWWHRRRVEQEHAEAVRKQLLEEYVEKVDRRDPDALEASRDFADNDAAPWRFEVAASGIFIGFSVLLVLLILLFEGIQHLTGG